MVLPQPPSSYISSIWRCLFSLSFNIKEGSLIRQSLVFRDFQSFCEFSCGVNAFRPYPSREIPALELSGDAAQWFLFFYMCVRVTRYVAIAARWRITILVDVHSATRMSNGVDRAFLIWHERIHMPLFTLRLLFWAFVYLDTQRSLSICRLKISPNVKFFKRNL